MQPKSLLFVWHPLGLSARGDMCAMQVVGETRKNKLWRS